MSEPRIPYIDPDNVMHPDDVKKAVDAIDNKKSNPVVEMEAGRVMPLAIYSSDLGLLGKDVNLMMTITHHIKENKLEMRGRLRFEDTQNKQVFHSEPVENTKKNYDDIIHRMKTFLDEFPMPLAQKQPPMLLEFEEGESAESVMHKMERSNRFNIGVNIMKKDGK